MDKGTQVILAFAGGHDPLRRHRWDLSLLDDRSFILPTTPPQTEEPQTTPSGPRPASRTLIQGLNSGEATRFQSLQTASLQQEAGGIPARVAPSPHSPAPSSSFPSETQAEERGSNTFLFYYFYFREGAGAGGNREKDQCKRHTLISCLPYAPS